MFPASMPWPMMTKKMFYKFLLLSKSCDCTPILPKVILNIKTLFIQLTALPLEEFGWEQKLPPHRYSTEGIVQKVLLTTNTNHPLKSSPWLSVCPSYSGYLWIRPIQYTKPLLKGSANGTLAGFGINHFNNRIVNLILMLPVILMNCFPAINNDGQNGIYC
jgi:hypothetical protein